MSNRPSAASALLPAGFHDRLPPGAEGSMHLVRTITDGFSRYGYLRVQPPLVEYEASILRWLGKPQRTALFRSSDPATGDGIALRPDITGQVARIAATRLKGRPRPLRLAYTGQVLRARASQLDPARELTQAGAELIGTDSTAAVAEIIHAAIDALTATGITRLSIDITTPDLVAELAGSKWPVARLDDLLVALDMKDEGALDALGAAPYKALLRATGPADAALSTLGPIAPELAARLARLVEKLPDVRVTIDPTERHGFEYQTWVGFSLFGAANGATMRTEIGRGGSYVVQHPDGTTEPATGVSLYIDPLLEAGLGNGAARRIFLPLGTAPDTAARLRHEGWYTVAALSEHDTADGCTHIWDGTSTTAKD